MDYSQNPHAFRQLLFGKLQQENTLLVPGWQRSTAPQQRLNIIQRIAAELRGIRSELPEQEALKLAFSFEQKAFHEAPQAAIYAQSCQRKLQEVAHARQQQAQMATQSFPRSTMPPYQSQVGPTPQLHASINAVSREQVSTRAGEIFHNLSDKQKHELTMRANGLPEHTKSGLQSQGINPLVFILRQIALQQIQAERVKPDVMARQQEALRRQQLGQVVVPGGMNPENNVWASNGYSQPSTLPNLNKPIVQPQMRNDNLQQSDAARQQLLQQRYRQMQADASAAKPAFLQHHPEWDAQALPERLRASIQPPLPVGVMTWGQFKQHMASRNPRMSGQILQRITERQTQLFEQPQAQINGAGTAVDGAAAPSPLELTLFKSLFKRQLPETATVGDLSALLMRRPDVRAKIQAFAKQQAAQAANPPNPVPAHPDQGAVKAQPTPPQSSSGSKEDSKMAEMNNNIRRIQSMLKEMQPAVESRPWLQVDESTRAIMGKKIRDAQPWMGKMVLMMALMINDVRCQPAITEIGQMIKQGATEGRITVTLAELDHIISTLKGKMQDFQNRIQKRKSETAANGASKQNTTAAPKKTEIPPAAPTDTAPPFSFGRQSPQGTVIAYGPNYLTQDKLVLPPKKKRKTLPAENTAKSEASTAKVEASDEKIADSLAFCLHSLQQALNIEGTPPTPKLSPIRKTELSKTKLSKAQDEKAWAKAKVSQQWLRSLWQSVRRIDEPRIAASDEFKESETLQGPISAEFVLGIEGLGGTQISRLNRGLTNAEL